MSAKRKPRFPRPKDYALASECVQRGIRWGIRHAMKHQGGEVAQVVFEQEDNLVGHIYDDVMLELSENFTFAEIEALDKG